MPQCIHPCDSRSSKSQRSFPCASPPNLRLDPHDRQHMTSVKPLIRVSTFSMSPCTCLRNSRSSDPRFSDEGNQRYRCHSFSNGCDQIAKSHIVISGFLLSSELDISKSRSLIPDTLLTSLVVSHVLNTTTCHSDS
jgi:hypothetical protein